MWRRRRRLRRRTPACAFSSWARLGGWQAVGRLYFFRKWFSAETLSGLARVAPDRDSQRVHRAVEWSRSVDSPPPTGVTATGVTPHSLCGTTYLRAYLRLYFYLDCRVSCRILRENSSWYKIYHSLARVPPPRAEGIPVAWFILVPASGACKCTILNMSLTKSVKLLNSGVCIEIHSLPLSSCCPRVAKGRGWHRGQARQTLAMIRGQTGRYHPVQSTRVLCGIVRA